MANSLGSVSATEGVPRWLHHYTVAMAFSVLVLIFIGGLVTSTGSGLAVPDWPLSYGMLFPPMVGGIFYEHGHRMVAATIGLMAVILVLLQWKWEPRLWMRRLGLVALAAVCLQGLLGGLTVLYLLPTSVSVAHACLAQAFFCIVISIAVFTSNAWIAAAPKLAEHRQFMRESHPWKWSVLASVVIYLQLILGAIMRHTGAGLAIPDFPLFFGHLLPPEWSWPIAIHFSHRLGALGVTVMILLTARRIWKKGGFSQRVRNYTALLLLLLATQVTLGAYTVWTHKSVSITTFHVATGAAVLGTCLLLTLWTYLDAITQNRS